MAKAKSKERATIVHVMPFDGLAYLNALQRNVENIETMRVCCGAKLFVSGSEPTSWLRPTVTLTTGATRKPADWPWKGHNTKPCGTCRRLAKLEPAQRAAELQKIIAKRKDNGAAQKLARADRQLEERAELDAKIEAARVEALAILDHLEATEQMLTRCDRRWHTGMLTPEEFKLATTKNGVWRCNLPKGHSDRCHPQLPGEAPHVEFGDVFALAIAARKRDLGRNDRGGHGYVLRQRWACNGCEWEGYNPPISPRATSVNRLRACPVCLYEVEPQQGVHQKDAVCRFCDVVIERDLRLGTVATPEINAHVLRCGLRYLGGVKLREPDPPELPLTCRHCGLKMRLLEIDADPPEYEDETGHSNCSCAPNHEPTVDLPTASFVLTYDEDGEATP